MSKVQFKLRSSGDGESSITEGLRTALARLRQRSTPPGSQSPSHQSPPNCVAPESCSSRSGSPRTTTSTITSTNTTTTTTGHSNSSHCPSSPRPRMTVNSQSGPRSPRPPDDLISTATSALRRLHFKTGRNATKNSTASAKTQSQSQPVPKVIVMGSSTASETTINTSTDSSNTIVTTMTATDGDVTEDSLDITEPMDILNTENVILEGSRTPHQGSPNQILQPLPASPKTPVTAKPLQPAATTHHHHQQESKFNFDVDVPTPKAFYKEERKFVFDNCTTAVSVHHHHHHEKKSVDRLMEEQVEALKIDARRRNSYKAAAQGHDYDKIEVMMDDGSGGGGGGKRKSPNREHRRSFRKKLDVDNKDKTESRTSPKRRAERALNSSPETNEDSPKPKHRHKKTSRRHHSPNKQREKFSYDEQHIAKYREKSRMTPPLPDLRVDFFAEPMDACQQQQQHQHHDAAQPAGGAATTNALTSTVPTISMEKRGSVCLNKCLREVGAQLDAVAATSSTASTAAGGVGISAVQSGAGAAVTQPGSGVTSPINVVTNPLENNVHHHFNSRKAPQATIVVQQPSLSLDHSNVATILLKNGSEFVSNVEHLNQNQQQQPQQQQQQQGQQQSSPSGGGGGVVGHQQSSVGYNKFKRQKEENMKQLLDVANNLTLEEIHDFEMRYGSPHHNRSQSVKTPGRSSGRPNYLCLPQQRSRVASMPNTGVEEEYYRLRHFSITGKGVVNRGDSLKSRRSRSNNSVASSNSSTEQLPTAAVSAAGSARTSASCSLASSRESSTSAPGPGPYKVLMLGGPAVGKSSLVSQFMTSEYLHAYDTSIDDESGEKSVSVLLAGEESELTFIDFATADLSPDSCINKYSDPNAYCVVYSSADRSSLVCAENILQTLWTLDTISTRAVILVANKADLVRSKVVTTEEGKSIATSYDCKYIETSVGINHNVDELLVGILTQIRLKLENPERTRDLFRKRSSSKKNLNRNRSPVSGAATPTGSATNSPKKYRGSRTSASLKVRNLLGKVWARDSKSKSCENLHVL